MKYVLRQLSLAMVLAFLFSSSALAAAVGQETARLVAQRYIEFVVKTFDRWQGRMPAITEVSAVEHEGLTVFWLVRTSPAGFLLVSARDELSPVKVYSDDGAFDPARVATPHSPESWIIPEQHRSVVAVSSLGIRSLSTTQSEAAGRIAAAWKMYGSADDAAGSLYRLAPAVEYAQAGPIITTRWAQGDPYNRLCPLEQGRTLVGCVATAWSQLMRHWRWPDRGVGAHSHTDGGVTYTVNFAEQSWNWQAMPEQLTASSPAAAIEEVARLSFQVGVAADMDWGVDGSASEAWADEVLDVHFKYKPTMTKLTRSQKIAPDTWFGYFRREFDATPRRPVVMSIFGPGGGHEVLADGYQTGATNMVHLNMGWSGFADAYYDVTSDFAAGGFNWDAIGQVIVVGIEPDYPPAAPEEPGKELPFVAPINLLLLRN